jgi:hypothetical protein
MAKLSSKTIAYTIAGGYVHIIIPDGGGGWVSRRILLSDFIGASNVASFTDLDDVIASYTGNQYKILRVNSEETAIEGIDQYNLFEGLIHAATESTTLDEEDEFPFWKNVGGVLRKITFLNLRTALKSAFELIFQGILVSGTNIKTVNSNSLLGSGNISITSAVDWGNITGTLSSQTDLQNELDDKQNDLGFIPENTSNKDASNGYVGLTLFAHNFWNAAKTFLTTVIGTATQTRVISLPDDDGTLALTKNVAALAGAIFSGEVKFNKTVEQPAYANEFSASKTIDFSLSNIQTMTITGDSTVTASNLREGVSIFIYTNDGTAGWTVTLHSSFGTATDNSATPNEGANKINIVTIIKYGVIARYTIETSD